jgi:hypothetical protein
LAEVEIRNNKIDTIVKDKRYYVDDYLVLANGNFLLITSKINIPGFNVCYYDRLKKIKQSRTFKTEESGYFITDCFKNVHLVTNVFSRQIYFDSDSSFEFLPKYTRDVFENTLASCMLKIDTGLIMKRMLPPEIIHLPNYDVEKSPSLLSYYRAYKNGQQPFYTVYYNARMREMIHNEMTDWALMGTFDDKVCNNISLFYRKIAGPLYAPLFLKNDTVVVFNFQENGIFFLSKTGLILKKVEMDLEQFSTIHDFEILHDAMAQTFYIKLKESNRSFIKRINIYSGTISKSIHLEKAFARNIQIVNNRIYYMVREREWDDTQYLYQQN